MRGYYGSCLHQSTKTAIVVRLTMPSSSHEFFKVFLLSSDYRPSVDRPSTERWPITDRYIGEASTNYRRSVSEVSVKYRWTKSYIGRDTSGTTIDRVSTESRPTIVRVSTDYRPTIDRVSTDYRPLYRPIDRSTLPTVNMIRRFLSWFEGCSFSVLLRHLFAILGEFYKVFVY